jgi:hypothetical protein
MIAVAMEAVPSSFNSAGGVGIVVSLSRKNRYRWVLSKATNEHDPDRHRRRKIVVGRRGVGEGLG